AGGLPAPGGFPVEEINAAFDRVLKDNGKSALQDGPTEGYTPLRQWVADDFKRRGVDVSLDEVLIVSGSQQALDMLGRLFIDPGSNVLVEAPSYLGALQSFQLIEPEYASVPTDEGGLVPDQITDTLASGARFLYALPNCQTPTGVSRNLERRQALVERCAA